MENEKLEEIIRFWSYCTWQGMLKYCPEKKGELLKIFRELNITPYNYENRNLQKRGEE